MTGPLRRRSLRMDLSGFPYPVVCRRPFPQQVPSMSKPSPSTGSTYTRKPAPPRQPLPNRLVRLLSEARWLATAVALLYFVLILLSYNKNDPGWSHENVVPHVANLGGRAGAWLADLLLFIFGFSAWWLCV